MNQIGNETISYSFPETGETESSLLFLAQKLKDQDESFTSGRIFNSFCTDPHPFAVKLYNKFIYTNLTKGFHRSVLQMETEAVALLADLFQAEKAIGYMTSGGTEANIVAFWASKSISPGKDEILVTKHTHYSIQKICRIMGLRVREVPLDNGVMDPKAAEHLVTKRTLGIHATAVYPDLGTIDPIEKLAEIATEHGLYLHVDAAYGGFILPFLKDIGYDSPPFDFSVPGVSSISVDPHKLGLIPLPAGAILFRDPQSLEAISFDVVFPPIKSNTLLGSRPGAPVAATWGLLRHLGRAGYREMICKCMANTKLLIDGIALMPELYLAVDPTVNILCIAHRDGDNRTREIYRHLVNAGFLVNKNTMPVCVRTVIGPHLRRVHVEAFLKALQDAI